MDGLLKYLHYGFSPNQLHYCGPRDSQAILDYLKADPARLRRAEASRALRQLLNEFQGAVPYLKFIARQNKIEDLFDKEVVEAYWLGNDLLRRCDLGDFYRDLRERFKKMISPKALKLILAGAPQGAVPHHSFHVLQVFTQTGGMKKYFRPNLEMVNNCLIRSGEVKIDNKNQAIKISAKKLTVEKDGLVFTNSPETVKSLDNSQYHNGDRVSVHWGWICEKITSAQERRLDKWTRWNLSRIRI